MYFWRYEDLFILGKSLSPKAMPDHVILRHIELKQF